MRRRTETPTTAKPSNTSAGGNELPTPVAASRSPFTAGFAGRGAGFGEGAVAIEAAPARSDAVAPSRSPSKVYPTYVTA